MAPMNPANFAGRREQVADTGVSALARDFPIISLAGREFTLIDTAGNKTPLPGRELKVVVIDALPAVGRKYYGTAYDPDKPGAALCWSSNGQTPDKEAREKQSPSCAVCPLSAAGSAADGKASGCGYIRPLIVYLADDESPRPLLYRLDLKGMSLFGGRQKAGYLPWLGSKQQKGYVPTLYEGHMADWPESARHFSTVVTSLAFTDDSVPALGFKLVGEVEDFDWAYITSLELKDYAAMMAVTPPGEIAAGLRLEGGAQRAALPPPTRASAPAVQGRAAPQAPPVQEEADAAPAPATAPARGRRAATQAAAPEPTRSRRAPAEPEIIPPEPRTAPATSRRGGGGATVPSKITPEVVSTDDLGAFADALDQI